MTRTSVRNSQRHASRRRGFTLTEVLLVLAILGVIAAMVVPNLLGRQREALIKSTKMSIKSMEDACEQYAVNHNGTYPTGSSVEVIALLTNPGADADGKMISPYLKEEPKDAWQNALNYQFTDGDVFPKIWSSGPNGTNEEGSGDDVLKK